MRAHRSGTYVTPSEIAVMYTVLNSPSDTYAGTPLFKLFLRGVNLNYRFRAVAKGLLRTIFFDKLFESLFYREMMNCFREVT